MASSTFLALTTLNGRPIIVNMSRVEWMQRYDGETHIVFRTNGVGQEDGTIIVSEYPQQILESLSK